VPPPNDPAADPKVGPPLADDVPSVEGCPNPLFELGPPKTLPDPIVDVRPKPLAVDIPNPTTGPGAGAPKAPVAGAGTAERPKMDGSI